MSLKQSEICPRLTMVNYSPQSQNGNRPVKSEIRLVLNVKSGMSPEQSEICWQLRTGKYFRQSQKENSSD